MLATLATDKHRDTPIPLQQPHTTYEPTHKTQDTQKTQTTSDEPILKAINNRRYIIALDQYFGFHEVTGKVNAPESGVSYDFDFMIWPSWHYVKIFSNLDFSEVEKYAKHPRPKLITFIIDIDTPHTGLAHLEVSRMIRCTLTQDAFRAAQALNAYIYFQRRIWTSHMGINLWEPLLPLEDRILHARDSTCTSHGHHGKSVIIHQ